MDRMNALPLCQTLPNTTPAITGTADQGGGLALLSPTRGNMDSAMPRFDPLFLDSVCYDYSLFSALPDFHSS